ncbi:hypothetical protein [Muricoccus aerilatus]|uniref:hypothetical protein n=1 Tax=Muricoccus aerilatus TaxID=452982 RepID=UPI000AF8440B|nr:hypothetical protein [Roseomonas aerilata]
MNKTSRGQDAPDASPTGTRPPRRKPVPLSTPTPPGLSEAGEASRAARIVLDLAHGAEVQGNAALATLLRSLSTRLASRRR